MKGRPFWLPVKWRDFYILWIWKIALIWIVKAEHSNPNSFFEIWKNKSAIALIFGAYGIGIGHEFN